MESDKPVAPAARVGLGLELREAGDSAHLWLPTRLLFGWLNLEDLTLGVPKANLRVRNGSECMASDYQRLRTDVLSARLCMEQDDVDAYVAGCGTALATLGVDELVLRTCDGYIGLSARVRESALVADLSARLYLSSESDRLRICCGQPRVYGHLDTPAPIVAHRLMSAILRVHEAGYTEVLGLGDMSLRPLHAALFHSLPAAGWRLPNQSSVSITAAEATGAGIAIHFHSGSSARPTVEVQRERRASPRAEPYRPGPSSTGQAAATLAESLDRFRSADEVLRKGDLEGAMRSYRGELAARGPEQPFLVERILSIASARREYFMDGLELARQVLGRWPDFAPAHAAIASIAVAQGDVESGAARYRELSQASGAVGDEEGTVRAALAGARLLRQFAPDDSTKLYELVLEHRPGHSESAEALADRYRDEQRWSDLVRLIRTRLATTDDPQRQARDHARLAEVLVEQLGDPEAALAELVVACRLDDSIPAAYEHRAEVELVLGDMDGALTSLVAARSLHEIRDDTRARVRNLIRGGNACLQAARFETAQSWFRAALEIRPSESEAMRGAARAAAGLGQHQDAVLLWRELFDAGVEAPAIQAHYASELGRSLLAAGGSSEAVAPLRRAAETGGARTRAEAHALLARVRLEDDSAEDALDHLQWAIDHLASEEEDDAHSEGDSTTDRRRRAAELSLRRSEIALNLGLEAEAMVDCRRAFDNALPGEEIRKSAARALLQRTASNAGELSWIDELAAHNIDGDECAYLSIRRAAILASTGDLEAALAAIASALNKEGISDAPLRAALQQKAEFLEMLGNSAARADALAQRAALSGSNAQRASAYVEAAEGWLQAGELQRSVASLRQALQILADSESEDVAALRERALICLGECSWKGRAWNGVVEAYRELYASNPNGASPQSLLRWGNSLEKLGETEEAITILKLVLDKNESDKHAAHASRVLSHLYAQLGEVIMAARAQEHYASSEVAALSDAARADAWYQAGALYRRDSESIDDAKRCLGVALRIASAHLPALDALEQIARDEKDHERLSVILGRKVAAMGRHPLRQRGLLVRLADLQENLLGRHDVARETYRRVLELAPEDRSALRFAARDALQSGNLDFACEALAKLAEELPGDGDLSLSAEELITQRRDSVFSLASLVESTAGQASESIVDLLLREARNEDDDRLWRALEAAYRRIGNLVGTADTLGRRTIHLDDAAALTASLERIDIMANQLGDYGGALIALRIAQDRHPESEELAGWQKHLESSSGPGLGADELLALAKSAQELIDRGEWVPALELVADFDKSSDDSQLLWLHVEAALGLGDLKRAIAILPRIAEQAEQAGDTVSQHRAVRRLADLILESGGPQEMARTLYARALKLDPGDLVAAELYAELLDDSGAGEDKKNADEEVLEIARRTGAGPQAEALALRPLAQLAFQRGDIAGAIAHLEEAIGLAPDMLGLYRECADIASSGGQDEVALRWLLALAQQQAAGTIDSNYHGERLGDLYLQIAEIQYDKLMQPEDARRTMRMAAESFGDGVRRNATLRQLASEANAAGCVEEAIDSYEAIGLELLSGHERLEAAKLYKRQARDHAAIALLESARLAGTLQDQGRSLLFTLHRNRGKNEELATALQRGAASAPKGIATTRLREALRIYEDVLANEEAAKELRKRLNLGGSESGERPEASIADLERAAEAAAAGDDSAVAARLLCRAIQRQCQVVGSASQIVDGRVTALLENLRDIAGRPKIPENHGSIRETEALIEALLAIAAVEEDQQAAADLLREVGTLQRTKLHDARAAADAFAQALSMRASDSDILSELSSILRETRDYTQLDSAYELHLSVITGPRRAVPLMELGRLCHHVFHAHDRARRCYQEAVQYDSSLTKEVADLLSQLGSGNVLKIATEEEIARELDSAAALEALGQSDQARVHFEAAAAMAPRDLRAFVALRRIYTDAGNSRKLSRVLEQLTTLSNSPKERAELFYERANLARDEFHDDILVYDFLREAAANDPDNIRYSHSLRTIAMARGEWELAAELTYREIGAAEDDEERGALYLELALIFDEKLLDPSQAVVNYEQALTLDPKIPAAPRPLSRLYELAGRHDEAAAMYERAAGLTPDPSEEGLLLRHAAMNFEQVGALDQAKTLYARVAAMGTASNQEATEKALARLGRLSRSSEAATPAESDPQGRSVDELEARLRSDSVTDPKERSLLLYELGGVYRYDLDDLNAAMRSFELAIDSDPKNLLAIDAMADACYLQRDWAKAHSLYSQVADDRSALDAATVRLRKAEINEALGQEDAAFSAYKLAFEFTPEDTKVLAGICRSAARLGEHADALQAQKGLVALIPVEQVDRLRKARLSLAELCEEIGDNAEAIISYEAMLREEPDAVEALSRLPELYTDSGRLEDAMRVLRSLVAITPAPRERALLLFELGECYRMDTGNSELAADAYFKAIDLDPAHVPTLRRLLSYYCDSGDFQSAVEMAQDLAKQDKLLVAETGLSLLYRAALGAALHGADGLCRTIGGSLGSGALDEVTRSVRETFNISNPPSSEQLATATKALCEATGDSFPKVVEVLASQESLDKIQVLLKALVKVAD